MLAQVLNEDPVANVSAVSAPTGHVLEMFIYADTGDVGLPSPTAQVGFRQPV